MMDAKIADGERGRDLLGQVIDGKYRVDGLLGTGGMGSVYRATHLGTDRTVALKVIKSKLTSHPEAIERFSREARAAGQLRHPNVVNVTDFGFWEKDAARIGFLVMEYLDGISLGDVLKEEKRLPLSWTVDILEQVCVAIQKAHSRGIVHRDLKPDNIWLEPNDLGGHTVKVLDFGLARLEAAQEQSEDTEATLVLPSDDASPVVNMSAEDTVASMRLSAAESLASAALTTAGSVLGTPHYMSPEQCLGKPLNHTADIYSIGVIAYEMLTGERPFAGSTTSELIRQQVDAEVPSAAARRTSIPRGVSALVQQAMSKDPEQRPQSAAGFASALRARSEGLGAMLRRALILYTEHFGAFLLIASIAFLPTAASSVYEATLPLNMTPVQGLLSGVFGFVAFLITFAVSMGLIVPTVANLLVRPLSPIRIRSAVQRLIDRARPFAGASLRFYVRLMLFIFLAAGTGGIGFGIGMAALDTKPPRAVAQQADSVSESPAYAAGKRFGAATRPYKKFILGGLLLAAIAIVVGVLAGLYRIGRKLVLSLLYGPAVIMEEITGREGIRRSRELALRIRGTLFAWTLLLVAWIGVLIASDLTLRLAEGQLSTLLPIYVVLKIAAGTLLLPVIITCLALLYFKARQSEGETLSDILGDYEKNLPPQDYRRSVLVPSSQGASPARML